MASSATEIVARLQLRADQFSSESGRAFSEMAARAKTTAQGVRDSFGQSFAEVQKLAEQSLKIPRTATGSLDLSGEIASLRTAATAADQKAAVTRELASAMQAASASERTVTESMRLEADAAMVSARAEEANANAIRQRILALEAVQVELNKTSGVTQIHTRAANDNVVSADQQRQSMMMLGQQVQDFSVQAANGGSVLTAFSQQVGQAGFALTGMGGALGRVGAFLGTWQGSLVLVALTVLPAVIGKILEHNNALDDAVDKLRKSADETAIAAKAQDLFARSAEGVAQAIRDQTKALDESDKQLRTRAEQANIDAKQELEREVQVRRTTLAMIEQAKVLADNAKPKNIFANGPGGAGQIVANQYAAEVERLQALAADQQGKIDAAQQNVQRTRLALGAEAAKRELDPMAQLNKLYDDRIALVRREATAAIRTGAVVGKATEDKIKGIEREKKAAIEAEQARQAAARRADSEARRNGPLTDFLSPVAGARTTGRFGEARPGHTHAGVDYAVPVGTPVRAPASGTIDVAGQRQGYGNAIYINFGGGTSARFGHLSKFNVKPGDDVNAGDIIGYTGGAAGAEGSGRSTGPHLHYEVRQNGRAVDPTKGAYQTDAGQAGDDASKRAEAALKAQAKAAREAEEDQRKLDAAYALITGRLDPVAEATRRYNEELTRLDLLQKKGVITADQATSFSVAAKKDLDAARFKAIEDRLTQIMGPQAIQQISEDFSSGILDTSESAGDEFGQAAGDRLRSAASDIIDMFGIKIPQALGGPLRSLLQPGGIEGQAAGIAGGLVSQLKDLGIIRDKVTERQGGDSDIKFNEHSLDVLSAKIGSVIGNAGYGDLGGGAFASITGGKQNKLGSAIGGALGGEAGKLVGKSLAEGASGLLKSLGGAAGPLGAIAGGILGSVVGGLFRKVPKASAGIDVSNGAITGGKATGTGGEATSQAASLAGSVAQGLQSIAETLGAKVTGSTDVKIGTYDGKWRVNDHGGAIGGVKGSGAISFDTQEQAISYAISDALKDGVLSGISKASLAILRSGQDLSRAIQKATLIESIPKDLKAILDPVGAAVDELNRKFQKTVDALKEGGASADQMAQAQQLYDLQLQQVTNSTASASQGLKDFLTSLKLGSNSPYSLRDQEGTAMAALKPFLDQIAAGQSVDQGKYQSAAQAYLDVERQLYGSTQKYFDALDAVQASTNKAISSIDNAAPIGGSVDSPFVKATADSTAKTATGVQTVAEISAQNTDLLARMADALDRLASGDGSGSSDFIGATRSFVARAA